jgi:maleate cis-trans isomerase
MSVDGHDPAILARHGGRMEDIGPGIEQLRPYRPHVVAYGCTSGSFGYFEGADKQAANMAAAAGVPAINTTQAFGAAVRAMRLTKVAIAGTYPAATVAIFADYLGQHGATVVGRRALGLPSGAEVIELPPDEVYRFIASSDVPEAEAVLVPDTALLTSRHIAGLEAALGKPVLTANQVTVWYALRVAGVTATAPGFGRLLLI